MSDCKILQRNFVTVKMLRFINFSAVIVKMVTDVSLNEISTPPMPTVPLFIQSPNVMISPDNFWTINFEQELDCTMRALLAEMTSEGGSLGAVETVATDAVTSVTGASVVVVASTSGLNQLAVTSSHDAGGPSGDARIGDSLSSTTSPRPRQSRSRKRSLPSAGQKKPRAKRNKPRSWSSEREEFEGPTRGQRRRFVLRPSHGGRDVRVPREYDVAPADHAMVEKKAQGRSKWWPKHPELDVTLTSEDIELLFFNRVKYGMPSRVMVLLTIKSDREWQEFLEPYKPAPNCYDNSEDEGTFTGIMAQQYDDAKTVDLKFFGPNLEREGRTHAAACGAETERYSLHAYCVIEEAENASQWCSVEHLCQCCVEGPPAAARRRYERLHDVSTNYKKEKLQHTRRMIPRHLTTQHRINVEQVIKLRAQFPNFEKPEGLEVPKYNFKDFAPPPRHQHHVIVADNPFDGELYCKGKRKIVQPGDNPIRAWSRKQNLQLSELYCEERKIELTSGAAEDAAIHAWLDERRKRGDAKHDSKLADSEMNDSLEPDWASESDDPDWVPANEPTVADSLPSIDNQVDTSAAQPAVNQREPTSEVSPSKPGPKKGATHKKRP